MHVHFARNGSKFAVHPAEEVPGLLERKVVLPTDSYWHEGMGAWAPVSSKWGASAGLPLVIASPAPGRIVDRERMELLLKQGWTVVTDGTTGVQLREPRIWITFEQTCLVLGGILLLIVWPLALLLLAAAFISHYFVQQRSTMYFRRE